MELIATNKIEPAPVTVAENAEYEASLAKWALLEDCYNVNLKAHAQRYITPPPGLFQESLVNNSALQAAMTGLITRVAVGSGWSAAPIIYVNGGFEPQLIGKTLQGFMSLVSEHDPVVTLPDSIEYLRDSCTKDDKDLVEFYLSVIFDILLTGRVPILIDLDDKGKLKFVKYKAKALIDWGTAQVGTNDSKFTYAVFRDYEINPEFNPINARGVSKYREVIHYHYIDNDVYTVEQYKMINGKYVPADVIIPKYKGKTLNFIPLVTIGSLDNTPDIDTIPLEGIANCVLEIFTLSCMLKHAEKTSAVPTLYMTGADESEVPNATGADVCITLADSQARVGYTTTDTTSMSHIQSRMADYYSQAQELGANLLGARRGTSESGEALRLRQAAATASLKSIVDNAAKGLVSLLHMMLNWTGSSSTLATGYEGLEFEPNREFSTFSLTANETIALVQAWQATSISHSTLLENFRKAGMLKAGETVEDELATLALAGEKFEPIESTITTGPGGTQKAGTSGTPELDVGEEMPKANSMDKNIKTGS